MRMTNALKLAGVLAALVMAQSCASTNSTGPDVVADSTTDTGATTRAGVVPGSEADLEQNVGNRVFFAYDQYSLSSEAQDTLRRQADFMKQYPSVEILVAGNCDERGTREYNLALGARRAEAARAYLVSLGVDSARIKTVSYGKERPLDPRSTPAAWALNRNATTTITSGAATS